MVRRLRQGDMFTGLIKAVQHSNLEFDCGQSRVTALRGLEHQFTNCLVFLFKANNESEERC